MKPVENTVDVMGIHTPLKLNTTLNRSAVPKTGNPQMVYLFVEIVGEEEAGSLPVNLGLLIDASQSMQIRMVSEEQFKELVGRGSAKEILKDGIPAWEIESAPREMIKRLPRKIDYVSEALVVVSEYLRHNDYFSLTAFADRSVQLIPTSPGKDRAKLFKNARELEYLRLGDETLMAEGLAMAITGIQKHENSNLTNRIMLLTDGYTKDVKECYQWARKAREIDLAITTMGVGASFNEDLLIPIAEMTGGSAYYLEAPDQIPQAFRKELGSALSVSYRNLKLQLKPMKGAEVRHLYRVLPELGNVEGEIISDGLYLHHLGHYSPDLPPAFLIEIIIPALSEGVFHFLEMDLTWDGDQSVSTNNSIKEDVSIRIETSPQAPPNNEVMTIIDKVGAYRFGNYALAHAEDADRDNAISLLQRAAARLSEVGEDSLSYEMSKVALNLQNKKEIDPNATKRIKYDTRLITRTKLE